jgi:hypothetical protein
MGAIARLRPLIATGVACAGTLFVCVGAAPVRASGTLHTVHYRGVSVRVPRSWPVINLARNRQACVRFNRHALYLGTPGLEERCPAHAVGRTEALLLSPLSAGPGAPSVTSGALHIEGDAASFSLRSAGVEVTATWSRAPQMVFQALGRKSLPGEKLGATNAPESTPPGTSANASEELAQSFTRASVYTGLGFDTCTAPSTRQMSAWSSSPYHAVGIYLGGVNAACAQPNLTKRWINHEIAAGWHPIPIWVGLQAPNNECGCRGMSTTAARARSQGERAASSAVAQAKRLGISSGNPIYNDMEGYPTGSPNTRAVMAFLAGWTSRLHNDGYLSGVYSSASSGIRDLVRRYGTRYREPNDIWIADWNGRKTTQDPFVPRSDWSHHQRLHQYAGDRTERHGGVTLGVDDDFLNGATAN